MSESSVSIEEIVSLPELEELASRCMSHMSYEYISSGAGDENTLRWNRGAFDRIALRPKVLQDVGSIDTRLSLFGREMAHPIILAPVAYQRSIHPDGEIATAAGAAAANATMVVSTATTTAIEDIAKASTGQLWFQLYIQSDREFTRDLVQRVEAAGCEALCLTVDTPVLGARDRQARARFELPPGATTPHLYGTGTGDQKISNRRRVITTWKDVEWLKSIVNVPLLLKGVLTGGDAELAIQAGAQAVIVSNHGGRNLDTLPATIDALPEVVERIAGRVPVLVDGGIRRGTDVLKAIAIGAAAVMFGRPWCYGLSLVGASGVQRAVEILCGELEMAMMLTGRATLVEVDASVLWHGMPSKFST